MIHTRTAVDALSVADCSGRATVRMLEPTIIVLMTAFTPSSQKRNGKLSVRRMTRVTTPSGNRTEGRVGNYPALIPAAFALWIKSRVPNCSNFVDKVEVNRV